MCPCGCQLPVYGYQSVCRLQCLVFSGAHWVRCASYDPGIVKSGLVLSVGGTLMGLSRVPRRADCGEVFQELWIGQPSRGFCAMQCLSSVSRAARTNACSRLLSLRLPCFQIICSKECGALAKMCAFVQCSTPRHLGRPGLFARMFRTLGLLRQSKQ